MDILDIFGHFYLNHLSPLWGSFYQIQGDLLVSTSILLIQQYRYLGVRNDYQTAYLQRYSQSRR